MKPIKLNKAPRSIWTNPIHFIASAFGAGASPVMPGTVATLFAIPFILLLSHTPIWFYITVVVLLNLIGVWLTDKANQDFNTNDHPAAAWDEFAAFPIAFIGLPTHWVYLLFGFIIFRFLDIVKPFPISWLDNNVHGGLGAMLDDIAAAFATLVILQVLHLLNAA